jgi:arylsulfatase A-like enzyme
MSTRRIAGSAAVLLVLVGLTVLIQHLAWRAPERGPNIVLISIDTLRPDHLSAYGHPIDTSPTLVGLARAGVTFANAYSTASWTAPAVVSLLTSVLPIRHGVVHGVVRRGALFGQETVPTDIPILADTLRQHGYRTLGVAANVHLEGEFGFARGFDRYSCVGFVDAEKVLEVVRTWKPEIELGGPYFAWVHFLDPHEPYVAREPWMTQFLGARARHLDLENLPSARMFESMDLSPERLDYVKLLYDSEIRYTDDHVAQVLHELGTTKDDLVIVVSDHGEEFGEHGLFAHGSSLNEGSVRIPLIVRFPREEFGGRVVTESASILDVFPTVAEVAHLPPVPGTEGTSMLARLRSTISAVSPIFLQLSRRGLYLRALVQDQWKPIVRAGPPDQVSLFNLREDPTERVDQATRESAVAEKMTRTLTDRLGTGKDLSTTNTRRALTPEQVEALKSLGYLQ